MSHPRRNVNAKLTEEQVREIRSLRKPLNRRRQAHSLKSLAQRFGVSETTICQCVYQRKYREAP